MAANIGVTDQPSRIHDDNQTLGVVENLVIEVALPLELRLEVLGFGDVQHQAAVLYGLTARVADRNRMLERINDRTIFTAQHHFTAARLRSRHAMPLVLRIKL